MSLFHCLAAVVLSSLGKQMKYGWLLPIIQLDFTTELLELRIYARAICASEMPFTPKKQPTLTQKICVI